MKIKRARKVTVVCLLVLLVSLAFWSSVVAYAVLADNANYRYEVTQKVGYTDLTDQNLTEAQNQKAELAQHNLVARLCYNLGASGLGKLLRGLIIITVLVIDGLAIYVGYNNIRYLYRKTAHRH